MLNPLTNFQKIPMRFEPSRDEWLETYLVRIARSNGLPYPNKDDIARLRNIYVSSTKAENHISTYLNGLPVWAKKKPGASIRYCPACFEKDRIVRTRWRISMYEMCTEHSIYLKNGVIEPSLRFEYNHPDSICLTDINNDQIWEGAICPMPLERNLALTFWERFDNEIKLSGKKLNEKIAWIIAAENLLDAIISSAVGPEIPLKHETKLIHKAHWLSTNNLVITPSFDGVLNFLISLRKYKDKRAAATRLKYMVRDSENDTSILKLLPLQELYSRFLAMRPDIYCPISNGALPAALQPRGYISLNLAEGLLGQKSKFLYFLLRSNFFKKVEKIKNGGRTYVFLPESEVEGCRRWLSGCMTPAQVMELMHITHAEFSGLLRGGVLEPIEMGRWTLFRRDQIALIQSKFESVSRSIPTNLQVFPFLSSLLKNQKRQSRVFNQLVNEIWKGNLPVYKKLGAEGLGCFFVDKSAAMMAKRLMADYIAEQARKKFSNQQPSLFDCVC